MTLSGEALHKFVNRMRKIMNCMIEFANRLIKNGNRCKMNEDMAPVLSTSVDSLTYPVPNPSVD